jgi:hypothetical protein
MAALRILPWRAGFVGLLAVAAGCGSEGGGGSTNPPPPGSNGGPSPTGTSSVAPSSTAPSPDLPADPLVGLWDVSGKDSRGNYVGEVEVRDDNGTYRFIHDVHWPGVTVENGRDLYWLFQGTLAKNGEQVKLDSSLRRMDFITKRGTTERSAADGPIPITGSLALSTPSSQAEVTGTITGDGISLDEKWSARKPLPAKPIFTDERRVVPAHPPPSASEKSTNFSLYKSFHDLDKVKPYVNRPEFQAAVHGHEIDPTDLDFYRANKNALRVVNKVIDPISLAETMVRADAYRWTLAEKAAKYQADMHTRFIDPAVGMIPHGGPVGATNPDQMWPSGDSALWTAVYLASQAYRYEVTGEADAQANVEQTLDALLKLQEITGDWAHFARALRKTQGTGGGWHQGTGAFSNLDWLQDGNNDMIKGLFYGYTVSWMLFCEGGKTGHESYCARIKANVKHLADDVDLQGAGALASQQTNTLIASWLYAIIADDSSYRVKAEGYWAVVKIGVAATPVFYSQGIVDWSGTHLTFVGDVLNMYLAKRLNLNGDAESVYRSHIDASHKNLEKQRFANWHFLKAAMGTGAGSTSPFIADGVSRMIEAPYPKVGYMTDRRLASSFCIDPYPTVPWKNDWTDPNEDRTEALNSYPLFETGPSVNWWMTGNDYYQSEWEGHGGDYLHVYWLARKFGLLSATD